MNINCKKCGKTLKIDLTKAVPGSSYQCPSCGNTIRTKAGSGAVKPEGPGWKIRVDGESFGPYSEEQLRQFVAELRIIDTTEVSHPIATKGWVAAISVPFLRELLGEVRGQVEVEAPPTIPASDSKATPGVSEPKPPKRAVFDFSKVFESRTRPHSQRTAWNFIWDFCDPSFKHFVTPVIIKITWCMALFLPAFWLALGVLGFFLSWLPDFSDDRNRDGHFEVSGILGKVFDYIAFPIPLLFGGAIFIATIVLAVVAFLLWVRVFLEICIVIFQICAHLQKIEAAVSTKSDR